MNKQLEIPAKLQEIIGEKCCRKYIGEWNSLRLGFREKIVHSNERLCTAFYGEWEIGTYFANWEITQHGQLILNKKCIGHQKPLIIGETVVFKTQKQAMLMAMQQQGAMGGGVPNGGQQVPATG